MVAMGPERRLRVMLSVVLASAAVEQSCELAKPTKADSWLALVLVLAFVEQWRALVTPTTGGSRIAEVLVPVERKRGLVAGTLGPVLHIHTDTEHTHMNTGRSNTETHRSTDTVGNSREQDTPGQLPPQYQWGLRCRIGFLPMPGPKTMTMRRWSGRRRRSKQFLPS